MLKSYIKLALKVLLRRKFFTFVSLFGISLTLTILLVVSAFVDQMYKPTRPGSKFDRCLFASRILLEAEESGMGIESYPSYYFLDRYVRPMKTPEATSIHTSPRETFSYVGNRKLKLELKFADATFWDIVEIPFLEGRAFDGNMVDNADYVAVINDRTRREVFGNGPAVGEYLETTDGTYRVVGVIPREEIRNAVTNADIYVPITTSESAMTTTRLFASCIAFVMAADKSDFDAIRAEYDKRLEQARVDYSGEWDTIECSLQNPQTALIANQTDMGSEDVNPTLLLCGIIFTMILFMLFPAINLVNINLSRIIERSSEIGVRKAFGASSWTLVLQFVVENVVLTFIGGVIALALAAVILEIITDSGLLPFGTLSLNMSVFIYSILLCLFFGVFSGVLPAYRMSRLHPVEALKGADS